MSCAHQGNFAPYRCPQCGRCLCCEHEYQERQDGWWRRCLKTMRLWRVMEFRNLQNSF